MRVGVIGTGRVGLVTCVSLAEVGHDVTGFDADPDRLSRLLRGTAPFFEPGLQDLMDGNIEAGRLRFSEKAADAIGDAEIVFVCVGGRPGPSGDPSFTGMEEAAAEVARHATGPLVVAEKSTVPAGTAYKVKRTLLQMRPDLAPRIDVVSNPEFLREGMAVEDALRPGRILVGAESDSAFNAMRTLYVPFVERGARFIETDIPTAELAKHACNAFLALKISYANALARLCERADADVVKVADVMGLDPRIGRAFLNAGLGYGGFCLPRDLVAFTELATELGYDFHLLDEVARINEEAAATAVAKAEGALGGLAGMRIALLGLAFKPGTDDVRLSPAVNVARRFIEAGASVVGYDPEASSNAEREIPELEIASSPYDAAAGADCVVVCTEWDEFYGLDLKRMRDALARPIVVDGRNVFDPAEMRAARFCYYPTGRPPVTPGPHSL